LCHYEQARFSFEDWSQDSNEFLSKSLWLYIAETFLASLILTKKTKNLLFEVISLLGPTGS
jgi:hypothetical protein